MSAGVELGAFVMMPNHVHGVVVIANDEEQPVSPRATHASPLHRPRGLQRKSIGSIIGAFKSAATKRVNAMRQEPGLPLWQRNYYEHVIHDEHEWNRIWEYITANPARWTEDVNNPAYSHNAQTKMLEAEFKGLYTESEHKQNHTKM